jgi:hypothetical protein
MLAASHVTPLAGTFNRKSTIHPTTPHDNTEEWSTPAILHSHISLIVATLYLAGK